MRDQLFLVYGVPLDTTSGGTHLQNCIVSELSSMCTFTIHVVNSRAAARNFLGHFLEKGQKEPCSSDDRPTIVIDGIALLHCGAEILTELQAVSRLVAFIHYPFSEPWYANESWVQAIFAHENEHEFYGRLQDQLRAVEFSLLHIFDYFVAVGHECRRCLEECYHLPRDRIATIDAPLSPDIFSLPIQAAPYSRADDVQLVIVGTLCARKNQAAIIRALGLLGAARHRYPTRRIVLTVIGDENSEPAYVKECREAAESPSVRKVGRVVLAGVLKHVDVLSAVRESDAFVFASRFESFGLAPLEAAALGVPVLSTKCGVLPEKLPPSSTRWFQGRNKGFSRSCFSSHEGQRGCGAEPLEETCQSPARDTEEAAWCESLIGLLVEISDGCLADAARTEAPAV